MIIRIANATKFSWYGDQLDRVFLVHEKEGDDYIVNAFNDDGTALIKRKVFGNHAVEVSFDIEDLMKRFNKTIKDTKALLDGQTLL